MNNTTGNSTCYSPYSSNSIYTVVAITAAASNFVSLLANCIVLSCIVLFKWWSFFNQRLVLYLSLATVAYNVAGILDVNYNNRDNFYLGEEQDNIFHFCMASGILLQITAWMVLNAYICITASLLLKAFFTISLKKREVLVLFFIYATPLLVNWIPLVKQSYGPSGAWCWITSRRQCERFVFGQVMQLVLWYIPLYIILGLLITAYTLVVVKFWRNRRKWRLDMQEETERQQALKSTFSLLMYPLVYFVMNIFPLINRLQGLIDPSNPIPVLWFMSGIFYPQSGTGVAIAFLVSIRDILHCVNIRAALDQWVHRVKIKEYPVIYAKERHKDSYQSCK